MIAQRCCGLPSVPLGQTLLKDVIAAEGMYVTQKLCVSKSSSEAGLVYPETEADETMNVGQKANIKKC